MCSRNKLTPAQKAVKNWNEYKISLVPMFLSFLVIFGLSAAGIALNDQNLNGIFAGHLTIAILCAVLMLVLLVRANNHFEVLNGMPTTKAPPRRTYTIFCLLAILWIGMFVGLIGLWTNDNSTPTKKLKRRGRYEPDHVQGISSGAKDGPVAGCLTMDLMVGLGSFQVMYNLYASLRDARKANEDPVPNRAV